MAKGDSGRTRRTITTINEAAGKVSIDLEDWRRLLELVHRSIPRQLVAGPLQELPNGELVRELHDLAGGGCEDCDGACAGHGGCDFSFGEHPECGYVCNDGHIVLDGIEA